MWSEYQYRLRVEELFGKEKEEERPHVSAFAVREGIQGQDDQLKPRIQTAKGSLFTYKHSTVDRSFMLFPPPPPLPPPPPPPPPCCPLRSSHFLVHPI
jgi:hypothetical protein